MRKKKTKWNYASQHVRILAKDIVRLFFPVCWREDKFAIGSCYMEERERRIKEEYRNGARYWTGDGWSFEPMKQKNRQAKKRGGTA